MKTTCSIALLLLLALSTTSLHAQFFKSVGIKAGASISSVKVTNRSLHEWESLLDWGPSDLMASPAVSVFANVLEDRHFTLQSELLYLRKGAGRTDVYGAPSYIDPFGGETLEYRGEFSLQYLELALLAEPRLPLGEGGVALYGQVGPKVSYLLSVSNLAPIDFPKRVQLGYLLGAGVDLGKVLDRELLFEVRYGGDFQYFYETLFGNFWNRTWIFSVGTTL